MVVLARQLDTIIIVCCQQLFSDGAFKEQIISMKQDGINFFTPPLVNWLSKADKFMKTSCHPQDSSLK